MQRTWQKYGGLIGCALMLAACGGATSGSADSSLNSNEPVTVTGSVGQATTSKALGGDSDCEADMVVATNEEGEKTEAAVDDNCAFELELESENHYILVLILNGEYLATLQFDSGISGFPSTLLPARRGNGLALGRIRLDGTTASPTNEPYGEVDSDDDGETDLADSDDDNDGVYDEEETDCDDDGFNDDIDDDSSCATDDDTLFGARLLAMRPIPHAVCRILETVGFDFRFCHRVPLRVPVTAWANCKIDRSTVTAETFRVEADGDIIDCNYHHKKWKQKRRAGHHLIQCSHRADPFAVDTIYTATIDGVRCEDGTLVAPRTWSWLTIDTPRREFDPTDDVDSCDELEDDDDENAENTDSDSDDSTDDDDESADDNSDDTENESTN